MSYEKGTGSNELYSFANQKLRITEGPGKNLEQNALYHIERHVLGVDRDETREGDWDDRGHEVALETTEITIRDLGIPVWGMKILTPVRLTAGELTLWATHTEIAGLGASAEIISVPYDTPLLIAGQSDPNGPYDLFFGTGDPNDPNFEILPTQGILTDGQIFTLSGTVYTPVSSFVLSTAAATPEPSTFILLWLGLSSLIASRSGHRRVRS